MPIECRRTTTGGKGNLGKFIERDPKVVAAGVASQQQDECVGDALQHYLLKDEVDALISDAIIPAPKEQPLPPLRKPIPVDMRFAGPFGEVAQIINPPLQTKFQCIVEELKDTVYKSYWKNPLGKVPDQVPMLPEGFDPVGTTFGKSTVSDISLYDVIMPKNPHPDKTPPSKGVGAQTDRKYCAPPYNPDLTYGHRSFVDKRGKYARCCLTDDRVVSGTANKTIINTIQSSVLEAKQPRLGSILAPNDNISEVPEGHSFGILAPPTHIPECLTFCELNQGVETFRECLGHLNTVRRVLSKRFLPSFFYHFFLSLKYLDTEGTGWLPKDIVYKQCAIKLIRFDPKLIEPLLSMWQAFDGSRIEYKIFVRVINYREPSPTIPKIPSFKPECLDYRTTYNEMVKPGQKADDRRMAGVPSGRYFDLDYPIIPERCCAADKICLPQEIDIRCCITPSVFSHVFVDHRDMYTKREPDYLRRVYEKAGEKFSDERFDHLWKEAQKLHSQGWVCYETFRRTMEKYPDASKSE